MATAMTAWQAFEQVQQKAESIKTDAPQRFPEAASSGDTFRQGDIYVELLADVPAEAIRDTNPTAQLAPGTTRGSRHILDALDGVTMYRLENATVLEGPVLAVSCERTITHPEHGDLILPPGVYGITYQRQFATELRRVAD